MKAGVIMRDPDRLYGLYLELYRLYVKYGEDKPVGRFFYDIAQHDVFSIEDDRIIPELYRLLEVPDTNKAGTTSILSFFEMMCSLHERCPDMRLGQLLVCIRTISLECMNEPPALFINRIAQFIDKL